MMTSGGDKWKQTKNQTEEKSREKFKNFIVCLSRHFLLYFSLPIVKTDVENRRRLPLN